jgi:hypothetical protein
MPDCTWTKTKTGKVVETCRVMAQDGSAFCPRHGFLFNVALKEEQEKGALKRLQASEQNLSNRGPRTRLQHLSAGYVFTGSTTCRCGKAIEWWTTPDRKNAPYNPMPEPTSPAVSHFVTCTRKGEFRRAS